MCRAVFVAAVLMAAAVPARAAQPVDELKTCLADSTTGKDRKDLAKWIFLAMAAHPEMKLHAGPGAPAAADESSKTTAAILMRLLTQSCVSQARAVMKDGQGTQSMQLAFQSLGQLAMQELMADKSIQDSMGAFTRYLDDKKLTEALSPR
jgi:hypothetical protein